METNILGCLKFEKKEISYGTKTFDKIRELYKGDINIRTIDCNDMAVVNGLKDFIDQQEVDFTTHGLILVLDSKQTKN